ncbi:hypothetical protein [Dyadobacter sp. 3J3]|nr:hypothetical protein [Dyadobacter sp. 3J3]
MANYIPDNIFSKYYPECNPYRSHYLLLDVVGEQHTQTQLFPRQAL